MSTPTYDMHAVRSFAYVTESSFAYVTESSFTYVTERKGNTK